MTKTVIAVVMSDLHARSSNPACRVDDYFESMKRKVDFISSLCKKYDCPLIDGGDLFDTWKGNPKVESMLLEKLPPVFFSVAGNHEMPYHNENLIDDSSFNVLIAAGKMSTVRHKEPNIVVYGYPYSRNVPEQASMSRCEMGVTKVAVYHGMVWPDGGKPDIDSVEGVEAIEVAKIFSNFDFVVCGHNHDTFTSKYKNLPTVINPGSVMRSSIAQINHKPAVFMIYSDNTFEKVFIPIEADVFAEEKYKNKKVMKNRLEAFIEQLSNQKNITSDFGRNLNEFMSKNRICDSTTNRVNKIVEECKCQIMKN